MDIVNLKSRILDLIRAKGRVIFSELETLDGFMGDSVLACPDYPNLVNWAGVSAAAAGAIVELLAEEKIHLKPAHPVTCWIAAPRLPRFSGGEGAPSLRNTPLVPGVFVCGSYGERNGQAVRKGEKSKRAHEELLGGRSRLENLSLVLFRAAPSQTSRRYAAAAAGD